MPDTAKLMLILCAPLLILGLEEWHINGYGFRIVDVPVTLLFIYGTWSFLKNSTPGRAIFLSIFYFYLGFYSTFFCGYFVGASVLLYLTGLLLVWKAMSRRGFCIFSVIYATAVFVFIWWTWDPRAGSFGCGYGLPISYIHHTWLDLEFLIYIETAIFNFIVMYKYLPAASR